MSRVDTTNSTASRVGTGLASSALETVVLYEKGNDASSSSSQVTSHVGALKSSSTQGTQLGLDWALVELSDNSVRSCRKTFLRMPQSANILVPQHIASTVEREVNVTFITGYSGTLTGTIAPGFTRMRLLPRSKFQEVWTLNLDKPLGNTT
jgi:hypothetical protein